MQKERARDVATKVQADSYTEITPPPITLQQEEMLNTFADNYSLNTYTSMRARAICLQRQGTEA